MCCPIFVLEVKRGQNGISACPTARGQFGQGLVTFPYCVNMKEGCFHILNIK